MPRIHGVRERRHQPFWDSLVRTTGAPATTLASPATLFGSANVGQFGLTNLQSAGQLASDQTYVVLALRAYLFFDGTNDRALYNRVSSQLYFTFQLGDKPQFSAPCWYHPAGGGIWSGGATASPVFANGMPSQESILKLARPIVIPVRQNIAVSAQFFAVGTTSALTLINNAATDDQMVIQYMFDGLQTRDVQ
jgi:hypothetical protein